jgi:hypothetical protein
MIFRKFSHDVHTFGTKLGHEIRGFGRKISDHPFRKIENTLHPINQVLGAASTLMPMIKPASLIGNGLEGAAHSLRSVSFGGDKSRMAQKPRLQRS